MSTTVNTAETAVNAFQRRLDGRRVELNLSMSQLARRAGLPYSTTRRILLGTLADSPKYEQLEALARPLRWPAAWLYRDAVRAWHPDLDLDIEQQDEILQRLVVVAKDLSPARRRALLRAAEALHDNGE